MRVRVRQAKRGLGLVSGRGVCRMDSLVQPGSRRVRASWWNIAVANIPAAVENLPCTVFGATPHFIPRPPPIGTS